MNMSPSPSRPVVLFGYDSSPFTHKIQFALKLKQIPYSFVPVSPILPRPILTETFNLGYRKIPVLAIGRDVYCDTTIILEALEHFFPASEGYESIYPAVQGWNCRAVARGFTNFWVDKQLFGLMVGLMPPALWTPAFVKDREQFAGTKIDAKAMAARLPITLNTLNSHLSFLEPTLASSTWVLPTSQPSLADLSLFYSLRWGLALAAKKSAYGLIVESEDDGKPAFNLERYAAVRAWMARFEKFIGGLPEVETKVKGGDVEWKEKMKSCEALGLVPTVAEVSSEFDALKGAVPGAIVSVAPDDTGKDNPTIGRLLQFGLEELIVRPEGGKNIDVNVHFPRLGFTVKVMDESKL